MKLNSLLLAMTLAGVTGCSHLSLPERPTPKADTLLQQDAQEYFDDGVQFDLLTARDTIYKLSQTRDPQSLDKLLYYLRAFSYYGDIKGLSEADLERLAKSLSDLPQTPRLQEHFAVTLYRFFNEKTPDQVEELLPQLHHQLVQLNTMQSSTASDYALWETLRAYGFLLHLSHDHMDSDFAEVVTDEEVFEALAEFTESQVSQKSTNWRLDNGYWALAMYRLALPTSEPEAETQVDQLAAAVARKDLLQRGEDAKQSYTLGYHVNIFGKKELCQQQSDICHIPEVNEVLPNVHHCSESLFIRHQDLTPEELTISCTKLTSQEDDFHALFATGKKPVPNDHNDALQVVTFSNWTQYNAYGQLLYDISTDNGGMYIEGTPQNPDNQASFFAFRQFWIDDFAIWNLNHEYVHYLDGRYIKYAGFQHFPSHLVWWAEGMAEYIAKGNDNARTIKMLTEEIESTPSLERIFATEYKDGVDHTYRWSYLAIRFLSEHYKQDMQQAAGYLKSDYFDGYMSKLNEMAKLDSEFQQWMKDLASDARAEEQAERKINKINRYAYRDYLQPEHLQTKGLHQHF
ncbi:collagenase [Shewanella submarina]|uniref:Collagenase n=1 Tax=Shewanella submarina TaxID=2016376 RepID=A0ABV7GL35_9GAMM|nr:collagenase [Shewanella submarina]MCL1039781.1 collagenase [Shewanella submarina]